MSAGKDLGPVAMDLGKGAGDLWVGGKGKGSWGERIDVAWDGCRRRAENLLEGGRGNRGRQSRSGRRESGRVEEDGPVT